MTFPSPYDKHPVHIDRNDLNGVEIDGTQYRVLDHGETNDMVVLLGASKWRKQFGSTESVHSSADVVFQGEHSRDPNELLYFCANDLIEEAFNIVAKEVYEALQTVDETSIHGILNQFSRQPDSFVLTAGTPYMSEQDSTYPWRNGSHLLGRHMYSVIEADATNRTVLLADPHDTKHKQVSMSYDSFLHQFRRLAGVRLSE